MPCNCDHLEVTNLEKDLSKTMALLEELKTNVLSDNFGSGYLEGVYNNASKERLEKTTKQLCAKLQKIKDVNRYSLEMQMWWRDHQKADKKRIEEELKEAKRSKQKKEILSKLTSHEKELIGI